MGTVILCGSTCKHNHDSINGPTGCCPTHGPYMYYCNDCNGEKKMVGKVINYRFGMGSSEGFVVPVLHNWDRKTFDKHGYPVATCGSRLYPRLAELVPVPKKTTCKDCFK